MEKYTVAIDGRNIEVTLTQLAYIDGESYNACYRAGAMDATGNRYELYWSVLDSWDWEDESEACDWDLIADVQFLGN